MNSKSKLLVFSAIIVLFTSCDTQQSDWLTDLEDQVFDGINDFRIQEGLDELDWNEDLADFSRAHSKDMAQRDYFSHTTPDGVEFSQRIQESGIEYSLAGENIYMRWGSLSSVSVDELASTSVQAWWNSPDHKALMLSEEMDQGGVGCYEDNDSLFVTFNAIRTP